MMDNEDTNRRTVAQILKEAKAEGATDNDLWMIQAACTMAANGQRLKVRQFEAAMRGLERAGVDPRDLAVLQRAAGHGGRRQPRPAGKGASSGPDGDEEARADHVAYWSALVRGSDWPADVADHAVAAIEARGPRLAAAALRNLATCPGWLELDAADRSVLRTVLVDGASKAKGADGRRHSWVYPGTANATIGSTTLAGDGWRQPAAALPTDEPERTLADLPAVAAAPVVAASVAYVGRLGLMHGPAGGGKSTVIANAVARITTGRPWLSQPTIAGAVVLCTEDPDTWRAVVAAAAGDLARVHLRTWRDLPGAVAELQPVMAIVDTLQYVAHQTGSGELDSAREVDLILRPLEKLAREHGTAIVVTDHEPWAEAGSGLTDKASGTKKRPRHSGAKVATADYVVRCTTADGVTLLERGAKRRRGIDVAAAVRVDIHGDPVAAPAVAEATMPAIIEHGDGRQIVVPDAARCVLPHLQPGESLTRDEIAARAQVAKSKLNAGIKAAVDCGAWTVSGSGRRSDPKRFAVSGPVPKHPPPESQTGNVSGLRSTPIDLDRTGNGPESRLESDPIGRPETRPETETGKKPVSPDRNPTDPDAVSTTTHGDDPQPPAAPDQTPGGAATVPGNSEPPPPALATERMDAMPTDDHDGDVNRELDDEIEAILSDPAGHYSRREGGCAICGERDGLRAAGHIGLLCAAHSRLWAANKHRPLVEQYRDLVKAAKDRMAKLDGMGLSDDDYDNAE